MRNTIINMIVERARTDKSIVLLTGDLGYGCIEPFIKEFPDRYFNCGIAEQNMLAMAGGLALQGKKVFVYSIGNFDTLRAIEQIRNDICYMNSDVNIIAVGAGLEYGQLGFSHHATEDVSCLRALPNISIFDPATVNEAKCVAEFMLDSNNPCYVRLNKKGIEVDAKCPNNLHPYLIKNGKDALILTSGTILSEGLKAAEMLKSKNIDVAVCSCPLVEKLDKKTILNLVCQYKAIYTVEEQNVVGGFGSSVAEMLADQKIRPLQYLIGVQDCFCNGVGDRAFLRKQYKIDAESIAKKIIKTL